MLSLDHIQEITYIEQNLGKPYSDLNTLYTCLEKFLNYKFNITNILSSPHEKRSVKPLKCTLDTLSRAMKSIMTTPGDEIEKRIMLIEIRNYSKHVEELIKNIEQEEVGFKSFMNGIRRVGIRYYKEREKD